MTKHQPRIPHLDHVFLIMLENHAYDQIIGNSDAPFINQMAKQKNLATNFFAVGHPSLTNYLEVVGGSNFGVINDHSPDWHNTELHAQPRERHSVRRVGQRADLPHRRSPAWTRQPSRSTPPTKVRRRSPLPITSPPLAPPRRTVGKTIADQLVAAGMSWKTYQEDLGIGGADRVNAAMAPSPT